MLSKKEAVELYKIVSIAKTYSEIRAQDCESGRSGLSIERSREYGAEWRKCEKDADKWMEKLVAFVAIGEQVS